MTDDLVKRLRGGLPCGDVKCVERSAAGGCTCGEAADRIEKLEAALDDVAGYLARADWYYLKPETRETLEPQSYRGQQDDSALKADHPTALSAEDIRKMNHE